MTEADDPGPVMKTKNKKTPRDTKKSKDKGKLTDCEKSKGRNAILIENLFSHCKIEPERRGTGGHQG